jgi:trans-2,3-dihydro-3-hydroxyanthranilate isomerase
VSLEILEFNAFTANGKGGNKAAVIFGLDLASERKMIELSSSIGAPATVFVGISDTLFEDQSPLPLRLRFFTPHIEENVCGHGTIAALIAIQARGDLNGWAVPTGVFQLETNLGIQNAKLENGTAWLEYPNPSVWAITLEPQAVAFALGLELEDLHEDLPIMAAGVGRTKLVCAVPSTILLDAIEPNFDDIKALCLEIGTTGIVIFTFPARGGCFTDTRHFSLQENTVLEDAATGNAHAALAAYLGANQFFDNGKRSFSGAQGYAFGQPSRLEVKCEVQNGIVSSVWVGGKAIEVKV